MAAAKGDFVLFVYPSTIQDITIIATPISTPSTKIYTFTLSDGELSSDGSYLIFGPDDLDTLGTWEFEISSTGYKSIKTQYTFLETSNFFLDVVLEPNPSTHTFVVKEGEPIKYIIMRDGYKTIEETVTLTSDMTIDVVMEPLPTKTISVTVTSGSGNGGILVINGVETEISESNTYTIPIIVGTNVVFEIKFNDGSNVLYLQASTNTDCLPEITYSWDNYYSEFTMPNEDISCYVQFMMEPN